MTKEEDERIKKELLESYRKQQEDSRILRAIANALIIAAITFFSTLSIEYPPGVQNIWAASIGATLALLTQLQTICDLPEAGYKCKPKRPLGMLI